jgi:hypothetical protein
MSVSGGVNIINNGLVIALDAANVKSFKGEPTTNLKTSAQDSRFNYNTGQYVFHGLQTTGEFSGWYKITATSTSSNRLIMGLPGISALANTQYTASIEWISPNGSLSFEVNGNQGAGVGVPVTNQPNRYARTFTKNSNNGNQHWYLRSSSGAVGDISDGIIYYRNVQWEQKAYPTPFVIGTRGTTVDTGGGWVDRSGNSNHGELINNPNFSDNNLGALSFDGSNSSITIPFNSSMDFSKAQTICIWMKPATGSNSTRRNPYNQAYGGSGTLTHEPNQTINYYFGTHGGNAHSYVGRNSGFTVAPNELAFITVTRSQDLNLCRWYKNAQPGNFANAGGYSSTNNGSSPILIANGYTNRFLGDIYMVLVYNIYLTQEEIQQIFNATKGRFGL